MQDDPGGRLYGVLLPELRKRSRLFGGAEAPLAVVDSMQDRITKALGKAAVLKPNEVLGLYPDWQSLERARRENKITEESYQHQIKLRQSPSGGALQAGPEATQGAPGAAAPRTPTPRKRF
jgi:hypothetical protein